MREGARRNHHSADEFDGKEARELTKQGLGKSLYRLAWNRGRASYTSGESRVDTTRVLTHGCQEDSAPSYVCCDETRHDWSCEEVQSCKRCETWTKTEDRVRKYVVVGALLSEVMPFGCRWEVRFNEVVNVSKQVLGMI